MGLATSSDNGVVIYVVGVCGIRELHRRVSMLTLFLIAQITEHTGAPKLPLLEKSSPS